MDQIITPQKAKLGPDNNSTAFIYRIPNNDDFKKHWGLQNRDRRAYDRHKMTYDKRCLLLLKTKQKQIAHQVRHDVMQSRRRSRLIQNNMISDKRSFSSPEFWSKEKQTTHDVGQRVAS